MISLNVQWLPVDDCSGTYQWNGSDMNNRKTKTVTFFGTGEMRGQAKAITPPGSDYTDAYLSAFAAKPIPTRHIHRLSTTVYDNSTPIPLKPISTPLSISSSVKTSETRFVNNDSIQKSDFLERSVSSTSDRSSIYSSSFIPERPTAYKPFSNIQYSSPQSQTFTSSYSTSLRTPTSTLTTVSTPSFESQRSYTSVQNRPQTFSPTYTHVHRSKSAYESIYKPMPAYSVESYPPSNTYSTSLSSSSGESSYKPNIPFQSVPVSTSYNANQSTTSERTVLPIPKIAKPIDRPETLLFQHDEDLLSSRIGKPSPLFTPSPQSPMIREELKVQSEPSPVNDASATTEPIQILESTLSKYDSLINQISEVLASVSPLSSTISSMSPGKSVLDYQLSSDSSPTLPHKRIEPQSPTTSAAKSTDTQRTKQSHLIRDDSYEKIVTAISDLDKGMISPSDTQKLPSTIKEEETEVSSHDEPQLSSVSEEENLKSNIEPLAEAQTSPKTEQKKEEDAKIIPSDEQQPSSTIEKEITPTEEQSGPSITEEETKSSISEEYEVSLVTENEKKEEIQPASPSEQQAISTLEDTKEEQVPPESKEEELKTSSAEDVQVPSATEEVKSEEPKHVLEDESQVPSIIEELKSEESKHVPEDESQVPSTTEEVKSEEPKHVPEDESQVPSIIEEVKSEEPKHAPEDESQVPSVAEEVKSEEPKHAPEDESQVPSVTEEVKSEELKHVPEDESQVPSVTEEVKSEEPKHVPEDESQVPSATEEVKEEKTVVSADEGEHPVKTVEESQDSSLTKQEQVPAISEESQSLSSSTLSEATAGEVLSSSETKADEEKLTAEQPTGETTESNQQQIDLLADVRSDALVTEELKETSADGPPSKKAGKHVRWDETVVDNEDDDSSPHASPTREISIPAISITTTSEDDSTAADDSQAVTDQQLTSSNIIESQSTSEQIDKPAIADDQQVVPSSDSVTMQATLTEEQISPSSYPEDETSLSATNTEQAYQTNTIENEITTLDSTEQQVRAPSPLETTPTALSDTANQQTTSSDTTESEVNLHERQTHSPSPPDTQLISTIDDVSTTTSDVISNESFNKPADEPETTKAELQEETKAADTSSQVVESAPHESDTIAIESTTAPLELVITSPIDTLTDTVSNRYISSDVYHGYLGDHKEFSHDSSDDDNDSTTKSLLASLRETITTPITPLIETIQSVVSSMQTTATSHPSESDSGVTDHIDDATSLTASSVTQPTEEVSDDQSIIGEDKSIVGISEKTKAAFENLREIFTSPITAITETIQTDQQEISSAPDTEQLSTSLEEKVSTIEPELSSNVASLSSDDHSNKETEETHSSLLENAQEKVSQTITSPAETIQDVVSTNIPSEETHRGDEQVIEQEKTDAQSLESSVPADAVQDKTANDSLESFASFVTDTTISTSSDSSNAIVEQTEKQGTASEESAFAQVPEPITADEKTEESTLATIPIESSPTVPSAEPLDLADKQDTAVAEISSETSVEQKVDENVPTETKTTLEAIRDAITHPIATITEKIQSIIPGSESEQVASDASETSKEHPISGTENAETIEAKSDSTADVAETKTTLQTIRDIITHPIDTITEKIQSAISTSSSEHDEQASSDAVKSTLIEPEQSSLETTNASITEEKSDSVVSTESKTIFESLRDAITHPIATVTEKIQSVISPSTSEEIPSAEKEIATPNIDQNKDENITSIVTERPSDTITTSSTTVNETVEDVVSNIPPDQTSPQVKEQILTTQGSELDTKDQIHGEQETTPSPISDLEKSDSTLEQPTNAEIQESVVSATGDTTPSNANQLLVETVRELINDTINTVITDLNQTTIENQLTDEQAFTWNNLVGKKSPDEELNQSSEPIKPALEEAVQSSDNITTQVEDVMQRSSNELESDSASVTTEIEKVPPKQSIDSHEPSPSNADDDSLELIHALRGHSIVLPSSPQAQPLRADEQNLPVREKSSSSTTTSSQVTSSDRYVSYAIHEMGDSSQERLPSFPLAADIPIYQLINTTSDENQEQQQVQSEPIVNANQNQTKDDDLTELDATENLTSYSDDVLIQKLQASAPHRQENLDASSTDEDVDDEFEQSDVSNLHRIVEEASQNSPTFSGENGQTYQRYDLSSTSSTSAKPNTDDIYIIPGYPGLWRPSADDLDDDQTHSSFANDADDEDDKKQSTSAVKTRTIVRTSDPAKLQSFLQQSHDLTKQDIPLRPDSIDIFNRPLNEFPFELSESDSFKTCASTLNSSSVSKQQQQQHQSELFEKSPIEEHEHQTSPDEKIFLIRERERGVSLPVTMKIDYDDMALRLSASTPIDAQLYSTTQTDLPSPSTHSEPIQKTTSSSRASTPSLSSNESEQPKPSSSSWLNTVNTTTTTIEGPDGPLESRTTIHKSAKGPISVAECEAQGKYIIIENTSRSKSIALAGWTLRQENDIGDRLTFTFPDNCLLRPNQSLKVLTKANESERRNSDLIASSLSSWHTGSNVVTTLINADGKDRASLTKKTLFS